MTLPHAIECEDLTLSYGRVQALRGVNLWVHQGSCFGFLGPNGAGKTTTLKVLMGQLQARGQARILGHDVQNPPDEVKLKLGFLPEEPALYDWMRAGEFLALSAELFGMDRDAAHERSRELLEQVGLADRARHRIRSFSRGMKQRVGIAHALVNHPTLLFLDEPVSALDPVGRLEVLELIRDLTGECTIFMSSHILDDVERVCDEVAVLREGQVLVQTTVKELRERHTSPSLVVEVEEGPGALEELLQDLPWAATLEIQEEALKVTPSSMEEARLALPRAIVEGGLTLRAYSLGSPSLEDIFIRLVTEEP